MNFRPVAAVAAVAFLCGVLAPATAAAGVIGLTTSLTGSTAGTSSVELTIDFDMNGAAATNLVGVQLYVGYSGLTPGAYALGSAFPSTLVPGFDYIELNGDCSDPILDCNSAVGDPGFTTYYLSSINLFPPAEATVPGTLFTLQFAVDPLATDWSLNLFGKKGSRCFPIRATSAAQPSPSSSRRQEATSTRVSHDSTSARPPLPAHPPSSPNPRRCSWSAPDSLR